MTKVKIVLNIWSLLVLVAFLSPINVAGLNSLNKLRPTDISGPVLPDYPTQTLTPSLKITAKYFTSLDTSSGKELIGQGQTAHFPPASTSKLMLAKIILDSCPLTKEVKITQTFNTGTVLGLKSGQSFNVQDLMYGLLLPSANDVAVNISTGCFGSVSNAVQKMNDQAVSWHLKDTHFTNPTGLDEDNNYSSARDLAHIADHVTADPFIKKVVSTKTTAIQATDGTKFDLTNTNKLLGVGSFDGIKTGSTLLAGENLITSSKINNHRVITVVLGSKDRFADTELLVTELGRIYSWQVEANGNF